LPSVGLATLGKVAFLPSANAWHSANLTDVSYRWLLTAFCRAPPFIERLTLSKDVLTSVLLSVNVIVTESVTLPSAALDKQFFVECPTKSTQQSAKHSAKSQILVVPLFI
jgi:hypothetical protein